ncbi:putative fha domain protein [Erysiphe neolycopersici]|uniref:Putative fha domain protein n=1 Tax=Erysiphe neolycopersici TaxID=212602 RepID=A0A420HPK4_9PEZI|nr:putative fha domain protein [Erysiphe neolycopersici]
MMGIQAKITFTSLNDTIFPVKRVITLDSQVSKITVSRASKSSSKSLHSAGDNAWFDSPVMSRDHAEISLDPECETLLLRDVGSMHGTSINNTPLVSFVPTVLHNGDVVVFGTEVKRGTETFPPCKFIVNYEISSQKAGNTFSYPEYSDYEDDDDISLDESDLEQDLIMGTPIERNLQPVSSLLDSNILPSMETDLKNLSPTAKNDNVESMVSETKNFADKKTTEDPEFDSSQREGQSSQNSESQFSTNSEAMPEAKAIKATQAVATDKPIEKSACSDASSQVSKIEVEGDKCHIKNETIDPSKCKLNESRQIKCRKRKADVISGNSEDEGESCTINSFPPQDTITSVLVEPSRKEYLSSTYSGAPPSKRQKIIESLGYVALGGFAAAAGLFSILVATAPDFS